ncbi:tetratricopeptide repeat protein [Sphingomonas cavernae]|nr:tetratricopeptide repeat protein [Sphingomonas cavernae]
MTIAVSLPRWRLLAATALLWTLPLPALAQVGGPDDRNAAGRALNEALNTLAADTHNVRALIGAGDAALTLDDPNGAIGFYGRADEIDPRNGRVKAGLARALLMLERPREALKLFDQATSMGVSEIEVARDRGLAYDLRGDQKHAQRDYALAMRRGDDPEVTRRMALSLGISGDREAAIKTLNPLLYKQDKAAWRARAFILAMNGDVDGANGIARQVMPGNLARPMGYFFARLGGLSPAQKAAAVHYGQMPSDGRSDGLTYAQADVAERQAGTVDGALIPAGAPLGPVVSDAAVKPSARPSKEPRRRPGRNEPQQLASIAAAQTSPVVSTNTAPQPARVAAALPSPTATTIVPPVRAQQKRIGERLDTRIGPPPPRTEQSLASASAKPVLVTGMTALPPPSGAPLVTSSETVVPAYAAAAVTAPTPVGPDSRLGSQPSPAVQAPRPTGPTLADIIGKLELEEAVIVPPPVPAPRRAVAVEAPPAPGAKAVDPKKPETKKPESKKPDPKKAAKPDPKKTEPSRIWAQIATGSDKAALGRDYQKMVKKAPAAFKGKSAWTASYRASRRLLVGPFDSQKQAQDFLGKAKVTGFAWTSAAGEAVEKLPLK